jgi:parallel beta-helix repeat protein
MRRMRIRIAVAFLVPGALIAGTLLAAPARAATRTVCGSGCDFTAIQPAVNAASAGDTIEVRGGTYSESVVVDKPLTFSATPGTTVDPPGSNGTGFRLAANNVTIRGFTIGNRIGIASTTGINVADTSGARIVDNVIVHNQRGISLLGASDVTVSESRIADNNGAGPANNAGLWGDNVDGITITDSTFAGHTNTAINLQGSARIKISGNRFADNDNMAVIWNDSHVTVADNTGVSMRATAVFITKSSDVTVRGNDLTARADDTAGVSLSIAAGASTQVRITGNVLRRFARGVNVGAGAATDTPLLSGNQFLTTAIGVRNLGTVQVDARGNWWGAASGPADAVAGDGSLPETNPGSGVAAVGPVDYRDWCTTDTCTTTPAPAKSTLKDEVLTRGNGDRVLLITVRAGQASVDGGVMIVRPTDRPRARTVVHNGRGRVNLGGLRPGRHVYTVKFKGTATAAPATKRVVVRVR